MHMVPLFHGTEKGFSYGFKRKVVQSISQPSRVTREQRSLSTYLIVVIICTGCINNALAKPFDNLDLTSKVLERGGKYVSRYVYDVQGGDPSGYEYDGEMTPEAFGGSAQEDSLPSVCNIQIPTARNFAMVLFHLFLFFISKMPITYILSCRLAKTNIKDLVKPHR